MKRHQETNKSNKSSKRKMGLNVTNNTCSLSTVGTSFNNEGTFETSLLRLNLKCLLNFHSIFLTSFRQQSYKDRSWHAHADLSRQFTSTTGAITKEQYSVYSTIDRPSTPSRERSVYFYQKFARCGIDGTS